MSAMAFHDAHDRPGTEGDEELVVAFVTASPDLFGLACDEGGAHDETPCLDMSVHDYEMGA